MWAGNTRPVAPDRAGRLNEIRETGMMMLLPATKGERIIAWFSCGAASAVAAKLAVDNFGIENQVIIANCDTRANEHPDNYRFSQEIEEWIGRPMLFLSNPEFATIDDVFERTRYMAGIAGARCTTELKKRPRQDFAQPQDIHIFGYTSDEKRRIANFENRNPELRLLWPLRNLEIKKKQCFEILKRAGIALPQMYELGYKNNNCIGCVKASSPRYWALVRKTHPDIFARRARQSRELGVRLVEIKHHVRIFLDELPAGDFGGKPLESISCGPECGSI